MFNVEILIPNPKINKDKNRAYSYKDPEIMSVISDQIKCFHVSFTTHPRLVDLCSGDGSIAQMMTELGWQPKNITCIDQCVSPTPVVQGVHWEYMDLKNLAFTIRRNEPLPPQVEQYRRAFDVVTEWLGYADPRDFADLYRFFARQGGFILNEGIV